MHKSASWAGVYSAMVAVTVSALVTAAPTPKLEKLSFDQIKKQLLRKPGQTEFLDLQYAAVGRAESAGRALGAPGTGSLDGAGGTDRRSMVESDVFAIDPATKNLYVLTDDRGLIVLDEKDETVGRVAASGNRPNMMYLFSDKKNLVVIEQDWEKAYSQGQSADVSQARTQLVQYDISNPKRPEIKKVVPLEGSVVDSRVVGGVLYITSSVYPQENSYQWGFFPTHNQSQSPKGRVYSVDLEKLDVIATVDSQLPSGGRNMIRIVEQSDGAGKFHYYALAVSPQDVENSGWWWRRASQVEVFDITDPKGAIQTVFRTSLQGNIQKATQVDLSDGYLIAVSNYPKDAKNPWTTPWRLVAESFKLPVSGEKAIKKVEAEYRLDKIKTLAEGLTGEELDKKLDELYANPDYGLRGVFVKAEDGVFTKYIPDSTETSGDTTGLSANLRDVRFGRNPKGELEVYAFWVPQNNIDPFDLFRFDPKSGKIGYVTRLQYEGWAERAIPFLHEGKRLILSLGYILKPNDPQMRRYPQTLLFEVSGSGKKTKLQKLDDLTLANSGIWADLQGEDKNITFSFDAKTGKGAVLFPVSGYSKKQGSFTGGKVVGFDLKNLEDDADSIFKDGPLLLGDAGWMKRVFEDSRNQGLRTFSNEEISAFPSFADALKTTDEKLDAIRRIELARDMIAFLPIADGMGLQLVRKGSSYGEKSSTQLRLVKRTNADTEATKIMSKLDIVGNYSGHYGLKNDKFLVFTNRGYNKPSTDPKNSYGEYVQEFGIFVVGFDATKNLVLESKSVWENKDWSGYFNVWGTDPAVMLPSVLEFGNNLLWNAAGTVFQVDISDLKNISAKNFNIEGAPKREEGLNDLSLVKVSEGKLAIFYSKQVKLDDKQAEKDEYDYRLSLTRNFLSPIEMKADGSAAKVSGDPVNIPGTPLAWIDKAKDHFIITRDNTVTDIIEEGNGTSFRANQAPYLQSLNTDLHSAKLTDSMRANDLAAAGFRRMQDALISLKTEEEQSGPIWASRAMAFDSMPGRFRPRQSNPKASLEVVTLANDGQFVLEAHLLPRYALPGYGSLLAALPKKGSTTEFVLALGSGSRIQVYELNASTWEFKPKGIHSYNEYNEKSKDSALVVRLPGTGRWYYWGWYGASNPSLSLDPDGDRLFISMGLSGVFTLDVADAPKIPEVKKKPIPQSGISDPPPTEVDGNPGVPSVSPLP